MRKFKFTILKRTTATHMLNILFLRLNTITRSSLDRYNNVNDRRRQPIRTLPRRHQRMSTIVRVNITSRHYIRTKRQRTRKVPITPPRDFRALGRTHVSRRLHNIHTRRRLTTNRHTNHPRRHRKGIRNSVVLPTIHSSTYRSITQNRQKPPYQSPTSPQPSHHTRSPKVHATINESNESPNSIPQLRS